MITSMKPLLYLEGQVIIRTFDWEELLKFEPNEEILKYTKKYLTEDKLCHEFFSNHISYKTSRMFTEEELTKVVALAVETYYWEYKNSEIKEEPVKRVREKTLKDFIKE